MGKQSRLLEILPSFLLFFLFTSCLFTVLFTGAKIYRSVSEVMEEQFSVSTCASYITAKVRHYDVPNGVSVGSVDGEKSLIFREEIEGKSYVTYLYCKDGSLMELFCSAETEVTGESGESIMPLDTLELSMEGCLLSYSCVFEGENAEGVIYLQCGEAGGLL